MKFLILLDSHMSNAAVMMGEYQAASYIFSFQIHRYIVLEFTSAGLSIFCWLYSVYHTAAIFKCNSRLLEVIYNCFAKLLDSDPSFVIKGVRRCVKFESFGIYVVVCILRSYIDRS